MSNKSEFKKYVTALGSAVCEDMMTAYYNVEGIDKDAVWKAIQKVLGAVKSARCNSNIYFDRGIRSFGGEVKEYTKARKTYFNALFNKINSDFVAAINEALKEFNAAVPEAVKIANKEANA